MMEKEHERYLEDVRERPYSQMISFKCDDTGYLCSVKRSGLGIYSGYVTLPKDHPDAGKKHGDIFLSTISHRLSSSSAQNTGPTFGFDCSQYDDYIPEFNTTASNLTINNQKDVGLPHYWTFEDTKEEVCAMAREFFQRALIKKPEC